MCRKSFEQSLCGSERLYCGCTTHSDVDDVDYCREPAVDFGNKADNVGQRVGGT